MDVMNVMTLVGMRSSHSAAGHVGATGWSVLAVVDAAGCELTQASIQMRRATRVCPNVSLFWLSY